LDALKISTTSPALCRYHQSSLHYHTALYVDNDSRTTIAETKKERRKGTAAIATPFPPSHGQRKKKAATTSVHPTKNNGSRLSACS